MKGQCADKDGTAIPEGPNVIEGKKKPKPDQAKVDAFVAGGPKVILTPVSIANFEDCKISCDKNEKCRGFNFDAVRKIMKCKQYTEPKEPVVNTIYKPFTGDGTEDVGYCYIKNKCFINNLDSDTKHFGSNNDQELFTPTAKTKFFDNYMKNCNGTHHCEIDLDFLGDKDPFGVPEDNDCVKIMMNRAFNSEDTDTPEKETELQDLSTTRKTGTLVKFDPKNPPKPNMKVSPELNIIIYAQCE